MRGGIIFSMVVGLFFLKKKMSFGHHLLIITCNISIYIFRKDEVYTLISL